MNQAQSEADNKADAARADSDAKTRSAQADADKKIADAMADFSKSKESYRHDVQGKLDELDRKLANLDAKASTATGTARTDLQAKLTSPHTQRDAFVADFRKLDRSSPSTWDDDRARLDKSWEALRSAVDAA